MLGLHGGDGAVSGGGDHLAQALDTDVAGGKDAGNAGVHVVVGLDVPVLHVQHPIKELGVGVVADEAEQAEEAVVLVRGDGGQLPGLHVLHRHGGEQLVAVHLHHHAVPQEVDLGVGEGLLLNGLGGPELIPAVDDGHLPGELGQVHGLLHRAVAAAHHVDLKVLEEGRVAGGAEGDALAGELALVLAADGLGEGAGGDDDALGQVLALDAHQLLHLAGELHALDGVAAPLGAELLGLLGHPGDEAGAAFALHHLAGVVLDLVGDGDLSAVLALLDDEGAQAAAAGIQAGGEAGGAGAQNDHVVNFAHWKI